jgi:hypothetical protein
VKKGYLWGTTVNKDPVPVAPASNFNFINTNAEVPSHGSKKCYLTLYVYFVTEMRLFVVQSDFKQALGDRSVLTQALAELHKLSAYVHILLVCLEKSCFENVPMLHGLRCKQAHSSTAKQQQSKDKQGLAMSGMGLKLCKSDCATDQSVLFPLSLRDAMNYSVGAYADDDGQFTFAMQSWLQLDPLSGY